MRGVLLALGSLSLCGCSDIFGESSGTSTPSGDTPSTTTPAVSNSVTTLSGVVFKGPSQCSVSVVDPSGQSISGAAVTSDVNGAFSVQVNDFTGLAFVEATNCSYVNETTGNLEINQSFVAGVVFPAEGGDAPLTVSLTPFTSAAVASAETDAGGRGDITAAQMQAANAAISASLGIENLNIVTTTPALATTASTGNAPEEEAYGLLLAAISGTDDLEETIETISTGLGANADDAAREASFSVLLDGAAAFEQSGRNQAAQSAVNIVVATTTEGEATGSAPISDVAETFALGGQEGVAVSLDLSSLNLFTDSDSEGLTLRVFDLPPGLIFSGEGTIVGTPTSAGGFSLSVVALDGTGNAAFLAIPFEIAAAASGDGGSSGGAGNGSDTPPPPPPPVTQGPILTLDGIVFKGPAACSVDVFDGSGQSISSGSSASGSNGAFTLFVADFTGPAFIEATNCTYTNETTSETETSAAFVAGVNIPALNEDATLTVALTPFTSAAVSDAEITAGSRGAITVNQIQAANSQFSAMTGASGLDIVTTIPALATERNQSAGDAEEAYGLLLAAMSGAGNLTEATSLISEGLASAANTSAQEAAFDRLLDGAVAFERSGRNRLDRSSVDAVAAVGRQGGQSGVGPVAAISSNFFIGTNANSAFSAEISSLGLFSDVDTPSLTFEAYDLPPGLTLTENGEITGTPTTPGEFQIGLVAFDGTGNAAFGTITLSILALPTREQSAQFLIASTFGPTEEEIDDLSAMGLSDWYTAQMNAPMRSILASASPDIPQAITFDGEDNYGLEEWYENAVYGPDQLRQRAAFALSQILVMSATSGQISRYGHGVANYMDIMQEGAFGNFRDLLEEVTYNPLMGIYLTYIGNEKGDPSRDTAPDENYAREVLQLFSIGLNELNLDGTLKLDQNGQPIGTYTNEDITELAKVFTGLWWDTLPFQRRQFEVNPDIEIARMVATESAHSEGPKTFLGRTVPAGGTTDEDISAALDIIFEHPNTAPFISKQLIQRTTTSNPSPAYVERVATTFLDGSYQLPSGEIVGSGTKGDLAAVWAAVFFDDEAFEAAPAAGEATFGKVREPIIRLTHWMRVADVDRIDLTNAVGANRASALRDTQRADRLSQSPYHSRSVFNFYRPGYVAPSSETADAGLVAPELQITNSTTTVAYQNFLRERIFRDNSSRGLNGSYATELALAEDAAALTDHLDLVLTGGRMREENKQRIRDVIESVSFDQNNRDERLRNRVQLAFLLAVSTPAFIIQN